MDAYAQQPPGPWDIPAKTPQFFLDDKQFIKVPYTSSVKVSCGKHVKNNYFYFFLKMFCLFLSHDKHCIHSPAIIVWELAENHAKTVPELVT